MKKALLIMALMAICCVMSMGCSTKETKKTTIPSWVLVPPEGGISASGSAKIGPAGLNLAKTEATANARDEIARTLNVRVKNMLKNFVETTGVGDDQTVDKVFTNVSKQIAKVDLSGSVVKKAEVIDETIYILVAVQPEIVAQVADAMKKAAVTSLRNEKALWQKFQAKKGHEELEKEIEKEFGQM